MKKHCILLFFCCLNLLMNTAGAYNLKQVADKEYMSNSSITSLCQDDKGLMWIALVTDSISMTVRRSKSLRPVTRRITYPAIKLIILSIPATILIGSRPIIA